MSNPLRLFVDRLTVMDFSYLDPSRGLVGESWIVDIELQGTLDEQGMVLDFSIVKKQIKQLIDNEFDHKLLIPTLYSGSTIKEEGTSCSIVFDFDGDQTIKHQSPTEAITLIATQQIDEISVTKALTQRLYQTLPDNILDIQVRLYPEHITTPYYHYSHGLSKHQGNCQRIAHGHRSRIAIFVNDKQDQKLEQQWCNQWKDIYIGHSQDIQHSDEQNFTFAYTAPQGHFLLTIPKSVCCIIDTDTTVENIADYIRKQISLLHPDNTITVRAFEGVNKGAISQK